MELVSNSTVQLIKHNASDEDVARAAWVSNYGDEARLKEAGKIEGLINFLYRERHMSPFEHGSFTFFIDTPIFVTREVQRHRTFSYNETSGRYKKLENRFFLTPPSRPLVQKGKVGAYRFVAGNRLQQWRKNRLTKRAYARAWKSYEAMIKAGIAREVARNVLPVGTMTQFYMTGNPRNFMQFFTLRNDPNALQEIQEVAQAMEAAFADAMPLTYKAYKKYDVRTKDMEKNNE